MVNEKRKRIVGRLAAADGPVSGEELSRLLGISRVAVWKHIGALREAGCPVESTRRGYVLRPLADTLEDWSFPGLRLPVHYFAECPSTMETARLLSRDHTPPYAVVAERQSGGTGRDHREWPSPPGGIYLTLVVPPLFPWPESEQYNRRAAQAVLAVLSDAAPNRYRLVPPARILAGEACAAGIMTELYGPFDNPSAAAIGIGIYPAAASDHPPTRREILAWILDRLSIPDHKENLIP